MDIHPNSSHFPQFSPPEYIICTGEASPQPVLHVWNIKTMEPINILKTQHTGGISQCAFSHDGNFIATVGMDAHYSIQVTHWKN